jgi:hypothetical protein
MVPLSRSLLDVLMWGLFFDVTRLIIVSPTALANSMTCELVTSFLAAVVAHDRRTDHCCHQAAPPGKVTAMSSLVTPMILSFG